MPSLNRGECSHGQGRDMVDVSGGEKFMRTLRATVRPTFLYPELHEEVDVKVHDDERAGLLLSQSSSFADLFHRVSRQDEVDGDRHPGARRSP